MKITRRFTKQGQDALSAVEYEKRTSRITNPDGSVVFEMHDAEIPKRWSQLATDIMVSKYFRKAGVPQVDEQGQPIRDAQGNIVTGPERSVKQVVHRLAGCWRYWGEKYGYFDTAEDAQAFYDELAYMLLYQMCAPNSPQWFNTGLNFAYGITGPSQGHYYCDPRSGELLKAKDAYSHPQPHACQPYRAPVSTPNGPVAIGKIVSEQLVGLEVYDGTSNGNGTTRVIAAVSNGRKPVYRIVLEDGTLVEATADHLIYAMTSDGLTGRWVRLDSLTRGTVLLRSVRDRAAERRAPRPSAMEDAADSPERNTSTDTTTTCRILRQVAIKRIEPIGEHPVYDIQTESGQYLSNNVIVHNCFIQSVTDDLVNGGGIMDLWTREARLFKYGSGTGTNFSKLRGENEPLSGGGKSSGLMSFLKIGDRAAGAIKSGGTTRRAAKMVCLDLDHPDVEQFINWKVREELKVACMAEGVKHIAKDQQELARKLGLRLDYDFNGEGYQTVSGQNSNNSVRIPNRFFKAVEEDGDWKLTNRTNGKISKSMKARDLWEQISFAAWRSADPGVQYDDTINQWHTCPRSGRINASNPCVTGDTRVLTPGGIWRRIDQMIHLPTRVVTNTAAQEIHTTDGAFPTGTQEVFELRTAGGYTLKLTADHKVLTRSRGWVEAKELTPQDEIKLPSKPACVQEIGEPQDPRFFQLLGLFLSHANGDPLAVHLDASLKDPQQVDEFAHYVAEHWGQRTYDDDYVNDLMLNERDLDESGNTLTVSLTNRRLIGRLSAFIRTEGSRRRLSDEAFTSGLAAQKHFLRALFTADAQIRNNILELHSSYPGLVEDIQLLLLGFGVQSALFSSADPQAATCNSQLLTNEGSASADALSDSSFIPHPSSLSISGSLPDRQSALMRPGDVASTTAPRDAESRRHGLRIDSGSLRSFAKYVGLLPGKKLEQLAHAVSFAMDSSTQSSVLSSQSSNWDHVSTLQPIGRRHVFDLTESATHSFIANGIVVHNCSEYMFLDDTACNLASLNVLTFFDSDSRRFDVEGYKHAIHLWTIVLEISVLMASFPSEAIATLSYRYRTLGLGYANLGAMLMQAGIPYDSEKGRAICAVLTAILTGESYATSALLSAEHGPFPGYDGNRPDMLRVIRNHRRAAYNVSHNPKARQGVGEFEGLEIKPVGIDHSQFSDAAPLASRHLLSASLECWDRALLLGERHGYRNAQSTVIAPTGTIGLLMDCDTTGVEPDFALVKFKKLAGGGYFKIANQSLQPSLRNLGYSSSEIYDILKHVMGTLTLDDVPHINRTTLKMAGFTDEDLAKIESALPGVFELSFAFSPWSIGGETLKRLGIAESEWQSPGFNLLAKLGFSRKQISEANDVICGRGCIEGAPHLKDEHLPVFDCANRCGRYGQRFIPVEGHIRMMAASQPFISGAISKTINLPNEATVEDIKNSYFLSWKLGLKANALYRDNSKLSQPLNIRSDEELDRSEDDDEDAVQAAKEEVGSEVARTIAGISDQSKIENQKSKITGDNVAVASTAPIEKIIERIVERPLRRRLPDTRNAKTHKFDVAGHEGYITVGLYDDGSPGEVFITMAKEGSTIGGLMDTIATLVSVALQYGVPVESLVRKFEHVRFEPSGMTHNSEIPIAKSIVDYIFRWLAMEFIPGYRQANAPKHAPKSAPSLSVAPSLSSPGTPREGQGEGSSLTTPNSHLTTPGATSSMTRNPQPAISPEPLPGLTPTTPPEESLIRRPSNGNGHGHRHSPDSTPASYDSGPNLELHAKLDPSSGPANVRLIIATDPLSQQGTELQADAPACDVCGSITVRSGTCYKCLNCGNSMGCS